MALGTTVLPLMSARRSWAAASKTVTVCSYGGVYQKDQDLAYFQPFQQKYPDIKIVQDSPTNDAKLKAMVEAGAVTWDIMCAADNFGLAADADWLEPIDYSVIDRNDFIEGYADTYRIGADIEATVLTFRKDKYAAAQPQTFADFFDVQLFPGKRAVWKYAPGGIFEAALVADGVAPEHLYPIDLPRALKKLETIKDHLIWWDTGAQSEQLLTSGEAALGLLWIGRSMSAAETSPLSVSWSQWTTQNAFWVVPKGTPNKAAAMLAIKSFTSPACQSAFSALLPYGPTNKNAVESGGQRYRGNLPTDHLAGRIKLDSAWWNKNLSKIDPVFQEWLIK
jgi:putative spermidine/putrescine transport system substrate-binding protein